MSEWMTFGDFNKENDRICRIFELHGLIKNADKTGLSLEQLHSLAQELADLTRIYAVSDDSEESEEIPPVSQYEDRL